VYRQRSRARAERGVPRPPGSAVRRRPDPRSAARPPLRRAPSWRRPTRRAHGRL